MFFFSALVLYQNNKQYQLKCIYAYFCEDQAFSVWIHKSHRILTSSVFGIFTALWSYYFFFTSIPYFLHNFQWFVSATLSCCQILYSICANFLHSETIWATVSFLPAHLHIPSIFFLSNAFLMLVLNAYSCRAIIIPCFLLQTTLFQPFLRIITSYCISCYKIRTMAGFIPIRILLFKLDFLLFFTLSSAYSLSHNFFLNLWTSEWLNPFDLFFFTWNLSLCFCRWYALHIVNCSSIFYLDFVLYLSANLPHLHCIWLLQLPFIALKVFIPFRFGFRCLYLFST